LHSKKGRDSEQPGSQQKPLKLKNNRKRSKTILDNPREITSLVEVFMVLDLRSNED